MTVAMDACDQYVFILTGIVGTVVCVLGMIGNILSLLVLSRIRTRAHRTYHILAVLALGDLLSLTMFLLSSSFPTIVRATTESPSLLAFAQYIHWVAFPMAAMAETASTWLVVVLTVHRYLIAKHALQSNVAGITKRLNVQIAVVWVMAIALDVPKYFETHVWTVPETGEIMSFRTALWMNRTYQLVYKSIVLLTIKRLIPIIVTAVLVYKRISIMEAWRQYREERFKKPVLPKDLDILSKVMVNLAIVFLVCLTPSALYPILRLAMHTTVERCDHMYFYYARAADMLVIVNSALNFYIFYPFVPRFRLILRQLFTGYRQGPTRAISQVSGSERLRVTSVTWTENDA